MSSGASFTARMLAGDTAGKFRIALDAVAVEAGEDERGAKTLRHTTAVLELAGAVAIVAALWAPVRAGSTRPVAVRAVHAKPETEKPPRIVSMTVRDFEFSPAVIHMKVEERVELDITTADETHGIRINPFPDGAKVNTAPGLSFANGEDCWKLRKGEATQIGIIPTERGTYTFSCCKACGSDGKKMTGKIIVDR
jgi:heme/copper-type cytochrome/quinol oxidase subunit 2